MSRAGMCKRSALLAQGGTVAAPVFASVMSGTLRLMDIAAG